MTSLRHSSVKYDPFYLIKYEDKVGRGKSVSIATGYELDSPGMESRWGLDFPHRPWGPRSLLYSGYRVFPESKERPGREADPSPLSSAVFKKE